MKKSVLNANFNQNNSSVIFNVSSRDWKGISRVLENQMKNLQKTRRKYGKTGTASKLVIPSKLSIQKKKKDTVRRQIFQDGINVKTPFPSWYLRINCQRSCLKKKKNKMKKILQLENWSLHFDCKRIDDQGYQLLVLKNEPRELKLKAHKLPKSKSWYCRERNNSCFGWIQLMELCKNDVADTTCVNPGKRNSNIFQLQRLFTQRGLKES